MTAQITWLPGDRLHLHHGPIDVILQGWGDPAALTQGYAAVANRFPALLPELCAELPALRSADAAVTGPVARRMAAATRPFRPAFITPMAAVAGAVAEHILQTFLRPGITRAYANNGGDIALHLSPGQSLTCAIAARPGLPDRLTIRHEDPVRGIATSGWRGRSHSLGIADAVTVLARTAPMADAAATMIANAVDLPAHPAITRRPARDLAPDSDLGPRRVTTAVGPLTRAEIATALGAGETAARRFRTQGLIEAAALFLHPDLRTLGPIALSAPQQEPALV
ncbi:MAG: hypothetical protein RL216_3371 [Pseudomonadota bacterium]|jgi:ApbE superfamily uncharacterized protein (UPF0280 family)